MKLKIGRFSGGLRMGRFLGFLIVPGAILITYQSGYNFIATLS
jgi:hypothetical protein